MFKCSNKSLVPKGSRELPSSWAPDIKPLLIYLKSFIKCVGFFLKNFKYKMGIMATYMKAGLSAEYGRCTCDNFFYYHTFHTAELPLCAQDLVQTRRQELI